MAAAGANQVNRATLVGVNPEVDGGQEEDILRGFLSLFLIDMEHINKQRRLHKGAFVS